jgi:hypothetical protein
MTVMRLAVVKEYADRTGKLRRYLRSRGRKPVALPGAPGSPEFMKAYPHNRLSAQPIFRFEP